MTYVYVCIALLVLLIVVPLVVLLRVAERQERGPWV